MWCFDTTFFRREKFPLFGTIFSTGFWTSDRCRASASRAIFELTVHSGFAKEAASGIELESNHRVFEAAIPTGRFKSLEKNEIVGGESIDAITHEGDRTLAKFAFDVGSHHAGFEKGCIRRKLVGVGFPLFGRNPLLPNMIVDSGGRSRRRGLVPQPE
jgi:hypothetical protein